MARFFFFFLNAIHCAKKGVSQLIPDWIFIMTPFKKKMNRDQMSSDMISVLSNHHVSNGVARILDLRRYMEPLG
jgi:hypothetical protein